MKLLEVAPEQALADHQVDGLVIALYENERPLQGLAGRIDWRLRGALSRAIAYGKITAEQGEVILLPIRKHDRIIPFLLVGAGRSSSPGERNTLPEKTINRVRENIVSLGKLRWAVSQEDLGASVQALAKSFHAKSGAELWVTH